MKASHRERGVEKCTYSVWYRPVEGDAKLEASEGHEEGLSDAIKCCYLPDHEAGKDEVDSDWRLWCLRDESGKPSPVTPMVGSEGFVAHVKRSKRKKYHCQSCQCMADPPRICI